jgi:rubrerythrin
MNCRKKQNQFDRKGENMSTAIDELVADIREESRNRFRRYEEFSEQTRQMGYRQAAKLIRAIIFSEKARLNRYHQCFGLLDDSGQIFDYYVCPNCGLVLAEAAPECCLLCDTPGDQFVRID